MNRRFPFIVVALMLALGFISCSNRENITGDSAKYDIDDFLLNQKIVFIMSVSSYEEPYAEGYFIDGTGKKHVYGLYDRPFESIEKEYAFLLDHYDEFETMDFFEDKTLRECTEALFYVNPNSEIRKEGEIIFDCPTYILYGIKQTDGHEEIVELETYSGILKRLDDSYADLIYELFGDTWYSLR